MKKLFIIQSNYIPWKGYFDALDLADEVILYDEMQYTKNDWRNRNRIKTPNGPLWLTVPIATKGRFGMRIDEAHVEREDWGVKHWRTIQQCYAKAPHFRRYAPVLEPLFVEPKSSSLSLINYSLIVRLSSLLGIATPIHWSSEFNYGEGKTERLVRLCQLRGATDYVSGPAAKAYLDMSLFEEAGIRVHFLDYRGYPEYAQPYGEFRHDVSVLDLLFQMGPDSLLYLKGKRLIGQEPVLVGH